MRNMLSGPMNELKMTAPRCDLDSSAVDRSRVDCRHSNYLSTFWTSVRNWPNVAFRN
jgi:hypothetical protein